MGNIETPQDSTEQDSQPTVDKQIRELVFAEVAKGRKIQDVVGEIEQSLKIARMFSD